MSVDVPLCPDCHCPLEMRKFKDGEDEDGSNADINRDWWCPTCELRWMSVKQEPMEAEG